MERRPRAELATFLTFLLVVAALYFGRAILMPLALALLLAFAATPLVRMLERARFGRVAAVIAVCLGIGASAFGVTWIAAREAVRLADDLPQYRLILAEKFDQLRGPLGALSGAAAEFARMEEAIEEGDGRKRSAKVEVVTEKSALGTLGELLRSLVTPLGTIGLVIVLALFILLEREELRDRMIWLTGSRDLGLTTRALDDAATRVSRYLAAQVLVSGIQGVAVGIGLAAIGVPGAVLWGALSAVLRFVPYLGPWLAAAAPIALSFVAFPGWAGPLLTISLFVVLELVSNNVLEPWLYGASVGLSPFGVILSSVFWASLWGIPGLLLAMPLTVCFVVAGRYVPGMKVFPVMLGNQPALTPDVRLYQRLIALDLVEAERILDDAALGATLAQLSDRVVLPTLRRLAEDDRDDALPDAATGDVRERFEELLAGVAQATCTSPHSLASEVVERVQADSPDAVCISALTPRAAVHARLLCKRLEAALADRDVIVGLWAAPLDELDARTPDAIDRTLRITGAAELIAALGSLRARLGGRVAPLRAQA